MTFGSPYESTQDYEMAGVIRKQRLSVILPTYNDAHLLKSAVENIYAQARLPDEFIIVDDGSTDNTQAVLAALAQSPAPAMGFKVVAHPENRGTVAALQTGLAASHGDYVYLAGSDDRPAPLLFQKAMGLLEAFPQMPLCVADFWLTGTSGMRYFSHNLSSHTVCLSPDALAGRLNGVHLHGVGMVMKREMVAGDYFDPGLRQSHDWLNSLKWGFRLGICYLHEPLATLVVRPKSWSDANKQDGAVQRGVIRRVFELLASPDYSDVVDKFITSRAMSHFGGLPARMLEEDSALQTPQNLALTGTTKRKASAMPKRPDVSVILPSRGRPESLKRCVDSLVAGEGDIEIVVGLDDDDPKAVESVRLLRGDPRVKICLGPRARTLGALANHLVEQSTGKFMFFLADDYVVEQADWAQRIVAAAGQLKNGIGVIYPHDPALPDFTGQPIISREMYAALGYFMHPAFPYWFADTWLDEIGAMLGLKVPAPFSVMTPDGKGQTHGLRDLAFWIDYYRRLAPVRVGTVQKLLPMAYLPEDAATVLAAIPAHMLAFEKRMDRLAFPEFVEQLEEQAGDPPSIHYERVKADAVAAMAKLAAAQPEAPKILPVFATPSLSRTVTLDFLKSWTNTVWKLKDAGVMHGRIDRGGDCFVDKVRNKLVKEFLDISNATDLFFIDDDLGWPADKVLEFLGRPEPILAGVYPKKSDTLDWPVALDADLETGELVTDQGLYLASFAGSGFLRIKRHVLEALVQLVPTFKDEEIGGVVGEYPLLFKTEVNEAGWFQGEDVSFFRLARKHGFELWVDPNIDFIHRGGKAWSGNMSHSLDEFRKRAKMAVKSSKAKNGPGVP